MNGTVTIRYRPVETMDRLHILLGEAARLDDASVEFMAALFSLPARVITKECASLERYGIGRMSNGVFRLTDRGNEVLSTWNDLGKAESVDIPTTANEWMLGPGRFCVPGTFQAFETCRARAKQHGIATGAEARAFIRRRHEMAIECSGFLNTASQSWDDCERNWTAHAEAIVSKVDIAESNEAIDDLKGVLQSFLERQDVTSNGFREEKSGLLDMFNNKAKARRQENRKLESIRGVCEAVLIREWISGAADHLLRRFDDEPGAFAFVSSVPIVVTTDKQSPKKSPRQEAQQQPERAEGFLRALFRWFTG